MSELNYKTLRKTLDELPLHTPLATVWGAVEDALDADAVLVAGIPQLPEHAPPAAIWNQIEATLAAANDAPARRHGMLALSRTVWPYLAAAALALLLTAWWFWQPATAPANVVAVSVTQEVVDNRLLASNWGEDDNAFALVQDICRTEMPLCEQPEFKNLKNELDELTDAKTELKAALGNYGDDPELHAQLARIERERSDLLRQMMAMI